MIKSFANAKIYNTNTRTFEDGTLYTEDGVTINGSIIDLFTGMKNFMRFTGITLEEAIPYATINPAKMIKADSEVGSLDTGKRADFILLENDRETIKRVYVKGTAV